MESIIVKTEASWSITNEMPSIGKMTMLYDNVLTIRPQIALTFMPTRIPRILQSTKLTKYA